MAGTPAQAPKKRAPEAGPKQVDQVVSIPLAEVAIGERLRPVDMVFARGLGAVMTKEGQEDPIKVCRLPGKPGFTLVTGGHRLEGARAEGWTHINAIIVDANAAKRLQREISENLWRKNLSPIDRATFVAELYALKKAEAGLPLDQNGRSVSAAKRWQDQLGEDADDASVTVTLAYGWADDTAEQIGLSRKTIYRDLELHRGLRPDVVAQIRGLPIASNAGQLRYLANLSEADQRQAVSLIVAGTAKTPAEAMGVIDQKPVADDAKKHWNAFFGAWSRMSAAERRRALAELSEQGLPKGVDLVFSEKDAG